jgi:putative salt-induced outer membrane protein YdiY
VVQLVNGDRLTGEIKSMTHGKLQFKTDATGTIEIEWRYVAGLQTKQYLEVELSSGARYLGQAPPGAAAGSIRIAAGDDDAGREVKFDDVVRITAIDRGDLLDRLDGYVTGGYDYTKASRVKNLNLTAGVSSRTTVRGWSVDGSWTNTSAKNQPDSARYDVGGNHRRFLANRRFIQGFAQAEGNDELGLDLRSAIGAAYGIYFRQTPRDEWYGAVGLAAIRENFASQGTDESIEAVLTTGYTFFRFQDPEANLDAQISLLPSLTRSGRVRSEGQVRARFELVTDLFFELSMYGSFDSDPDEEADTNSDYGITTSLGYSF